MGSISKVFKKVTKAVKKPISKAFKGIAKGIMKVGKATMRGVGKLNQKLGPLGSIALAIAMPYALGGLSSMTTAAQGYTGFGKTFINAIGTVGGNIRSGYQAFNAGLKGGKFFKGITNSISEGFRKFAPKGVQNMFSEISQGAKTLFNSAKKITKKYSPIKGKQGTVDVLGLQPNIHGEGLIQTTVKSADAAKMLDSGLIKGSQLQDQFLGSKKLFVQGSTEADKIISDTINDAYRKTTATYGKNSTQYLNDLRLKSKELGTYVNDAELGSNIDKFATPTNAKAGVVDISGTADGDLMYDIDLSKTGDYVEMPNGGYRFTGESTFKNINEANAAAQAAKKASTNKLLDKYSKALLSPTDKMAVTYAMPNTSDMTMQTSMSGYTGTDIEGSAGGSLLRGAFSEAEQKKIMGYYRNMNLIGSH